MVSTPSSAFSLKRFENMVPGVRYEPETGMLILRQSWGSRALAFYGLAASVLFVTVGIVMAVNGNLAAIVFAGLAAGQLVFVVRALRMRVVVGPDGIRQRALLGSRSVSWAEVRRVTVMTSETSAGRMFLGVPSSESELVMGAGLGSDTPTVVLGDGTRVGLTAITSLSRREGFSAGEPSPAETKAGLVARYHASIVGGEPTYIPAPSGPAGRSR